MKSVCICGSGRFRKEVKKFAQELQRAGVTVYAPHHHSKPEDWKSFSSDFQQFIQLGLTHDHFYKIQMSDVVFVYNKGGYSGVSTTLEMGYAVALGKPIYALAKDPELSRQTLFREVLPSWKELAKRLTQG